MRKFNTGNKDLNKWLEFYNNGSLSNTRFNYLIKKYDKTFLTLSPPKDIEDEINEYLPDNGVLEIDFRNIVYKPENDNTEAKTRIVLCMLNLVNFEDWKDVYAKDFIEVMERSLVEGDYEKLGIEFEDIISIAIERNLISTDDFISLAILRGVVLGERYPDEMAEKKLKKEIKKNKLKMKIGI